MLSPGSFTWADAPWWPVGSWMFARHASMRHGFPRRARPPHGNPPVPRRRARRRPGPAPTRRIDAAAVADLVGRGDGLTPLGDDVLCGWLAAHRAAGVATPAVDDAVRRALPRTTTLSATLLECALPARCADVVADYLAPSARPRRVGRAGRARRARAHLRRAGSRTASTWPSRPCPAEVAA